MPFLFVGGELVVVASRVFLVVSPKKVVLCSCFLLVCFRWGGGVVAGGGCGVSWFLW